MSGYALISVWNKDGLLSFVQSICKSGLTILSTGGTFNYLKENGIPVVSVSSHTGSPEILDGRVKTLHPIVHGGILARRSVAADMQTIAEHNIGLIDIVVVNLYPFPAKFEEIETSGNCQHESLIEYIDIGGPTMIRAAAKNWQDVTVVVDPSDYDVVQEELQSNGVSAQTRRRLAAKVFRTMAAYDAAVSRYLTLEEQLLEESGDPKLLAPLESVVLDRVQSLRYGENPHQKAALYRSVDLVHKKPLVWEQLQGKEISYNNLLDMQAAVDLLLELIVLTTGGNSAAVVVKHNNPCGAAIRPSGVAAFEAARACDPVSAFGGIVALSTSIDTALAQSMSEGFLEVIVAPAITADAATILAKKKNIRVIICDFEMLQRVRAKQPVSIRPCLDGYLVQTEDRQLAPVTAESVVVGKASDEMIKDLKFAWAVCKHVKSNAIVISKQQQAIGIGAGQMSRVDSSNLAVNRAALHGHDISGAVSASDAFLPFADTLETLSSAGVVALVQPGGSIKDDEVIKAAKDAGMTMAFTGERHFRH